MPKEPLHQFSAEKVIEPLLNCNVEVSQMRMLLNRMYTVAVSNAPDDEIDNFTAKEISPVFLAMAQTLENLEKLPKG